MIMGSAVIVLSSAEECPRNTGVSVLAAGRGSRDLAAGRGGRDLAARRGSRDLVAGKGGRDLAAGRGGRDLAADRGSRDLAAGRGGRDLAAGKGGRDLAAGRGGTDLAAGKGGRDLAAGRGGRDLAATVGTAITAESDVYPPAKTDVVTPAVDPEVRETRGLTAERGGHTAETERGQRAKGRVPATEIKVTLMTAAVLFHQCKLLFAYHFTYLVYAIFHYAGVKMRRYRHL